MQPFGYIFGFLGYISDIWYRCFGLRIEEAEIVSNISLESMTYGGIFFINTIGYILGNLSGLVLAAIYPLKTTYILLMGYDPYIFSFLLLIVCTLPLAVLGDSYIGIQIARYNKKRAVREYRKVFVWIYSLYRILFPDFFIIGALITYLTGVQMKKDEIWKLNLRIQLIRVLIGILFFCVIVYFR